MPAIDKARLYRGKGGEVMREAVGRLVASVSRAGLPLSRPQHAKVLEALDENLRHPQPYIQAAAVEALRHYTRHGGADRVLEGRGCCPSACAFRWPPALLSNCNLPISSACTLTHTRWPLQSIHHVRRGCRRVQGEAGPRPHGATA